MKTVKLKDLSVGNRFRFANGWGEDHIFQVAQIGPGPGDVGVYDLTQPYGNDSGGLYHHDAEVIPIPDPEECDAHSCYANEVDGSDGNRYCDVCGRMTKSAEAIELDAERYNYDRQNGDFETF